MARARAVETGKGIEDPLQIGVGHARPFILQPQQPMLALALAVQQHTTARGRMTDGIAQDIF